MEVIEIDDDTESEGSDEVMYVRELSDPLPKPRIRNILPSTIMSPPDGPRIPFATPNWSKRQLPDDKLSRGEQILKRFRRENEDTKLPSPQEKSKRESNDARPVQGALEMLDTEATEEMDVPPVSPLLPDLFCQSRFLGDIVCVANAASAVGTVLDDDQGLGKTIAALALVLTNKSRGAVDDNDAEICICEEVDEALMQKWHGGTLIVCPASVLQQWRAEICSKVHAFARVSVFVHHGKEKAKKAEALTQDTVVLTTYASLTRETMKVPDDSKKGNKSRRVCRGPLYDVHWLRVILDESHCIKNRETACSQAAVALSADYRWCMSGTPIQNSIDDLFPLFKFLRYHQYSSYSQFDSISRAYKLGRASGVRRLREALSGVMLRRTKHCTIHGVPIIQLPEKRVSLVKAEMSAKEREMYKAVEVGTYKTYSKMQNQQGNSYFNYLVMILRLRQASSHPWLLEGTDQTKHPGTHFTEISRYDDVFGAEVTEEQLEAARALSPEERQLFLQKVSTSQDVCPFCGDVPELPVINYCGHVFCHQCFSLEAEKGLDPDNADAGCPHCQQKLHTHRCFTQHSLRAVSDELAATGMLPDEKPWESSAKVDKLLEVLENIQGDQMLVDGEEQEGSQDKVLVFSQWTSMLDIIEIPLEQRGFRVLRLDGTMSLSTRSAVLEEFESDPTVSVLLMSLRATSMGINLTCANHVILLDLWWNPSVEEQAIDRVHRIGQHKTVFVTRITIKDTVDERVLQLQQKKRDLVEMAVRSKRDVCVSGQLTMDDIHFLFDGLR